MACGNVTGPPDLSSGEWLEDLEFDASIRQTHTEPFHGVTESDFDAAIQALRDGEKSRRHTLNGPVNGEHPKIQAQMSQFCIIMSQKRPIAILGSSQSLTSRTLGKRMEPASETVTTDHGKYGAPNENRSTDPPQRHSTV